MKIAIYKTILKSTGRVVYVGQTTHSENVGKCYFGSGIHKLFNMSYIREHFTSENITLTEDQQKANDLERYYIDYYCTLEEYGGFNIAHGGLGSPRYGEKNPYYGKGYLFKGEKAPFYGKHHTEETRQKLSESNSGEKNPNYGRTGDKHPLSKKCPYNGVEFDSIKDAYDYAKDYCGYNKSYSTFCRQIK